MRKILLAGALLGLVMGVAAPLTATALTIGPASLSKPAVDNSMVVQVRRGGGVAWRGPRGGGGVAWRGPRGRGGVAWRAREGAVAWPGGVDQGGGAAALPGGAAMAGQVGGLAGSVMGSITIRLSTIAITTRALAIAASSRGMAAGCAAGIVGPGGDIARNRRRLEMPPPLACPIEGGLS